MNDIRVIGLAINVILLVVAFVGVGWYAKCQLGLLALLVAAMLSVVRTSGPITGTVALEAGEPLCAPCFSASFPDDAHSYVHQIFGAFAPGVPKSSTNEENGFVGYNDAPSNLGSEYVVDLVTKQKQGTWRPAELGQGKPSAR